MITLLLINTFACYLEFVWFLQNRPTLVPTQWNQAGYLFEKWAQSPGTKYPEANASMRLSASHNAKWFIDCMLIKLIDW